MKCPDCGKQMKFRSVIMAGFELPYYLCTSCGKKASVYEEADNGSKN